MARKAAQGGAKSPRLVHSGDGSGTSAEAQAIRDAAMLRAATAEPGDVHGAGIDAAEAEVIAEFSDGVSRLRERLNDDVSGHTTKMLELVARLDAARPEEAGVRARLEIANARAEHRDDLISAEREVMAAERDLRLFRMRNELTREPAVPRDQVVSGAWLAVILVLEATFNTPFFLIEGQSFMGAAFEGLLVSAANVGLGLMAGMAGLRLASHREFFPWKAGGMAVFAGAVWGVVMLSWLMAMRRIAPADPEMAHAIAGDLSPMVLTVAFTAFSAMGFVFAAYKGWQGFFEPYPGYGQVAKRLWTARRRIEDLRHDFHANARQAINDVQADLDEEIDADRDAVTKARLIMAQVEASELRARQSMTDLRSKAEMLIRVYRDTRLAALDEYGAHDDGAQPAEVDIATLLKAEQPTAEGARRALGEARAQLEANEEAYATGLSELRQVLLHLERDLALSEAEAHSAALRQRAAELEHEDVDKTGKPKSPQAVRRAPGGAKGPANTRSGAAGAHAPGVSASGGGSVSPALAGSDPQGRTAGGSSAGGGADTSGSASKTSGKPAGGRKRS